jgi:hypothetical protein
MLGFSTHVDGSTSAACARTTLASRELEKLSGDKGVEIRIA